MKIEHGAFRSVAGSQLYRIRIRVDSGAYVQYYTACIHKLLSTNYAQTMSFLFDKKTKTTIKWIWSGVAILIILSMIFAYSAGF